jgi:hypothetical protein
MKTFALKNKKEFSAFEELTDKLLSVPHAEIKAKLEEEKQAKKRKKSKKSSAAYGVIELEGICLNQLLTPEGRKRSERIFSRNARKLRPYIVRGEIE